MLVKLKNFEWLLLLKWLIVNSASIVIGYIVASYFTDLASLIFRITFNEYVIVFLAMFILGIINGAGQSIFLGSILHNKLGWLLATGAGWASGFSFLMYLIVNIQQLYLPPDSNIYLFMLTILLLTIPVGSSVGISQWLILRTHALKSYWWIGLNMFAFGLATMTISILQERLPLILGTVPGDPFYIRYREQTIAGASLIVLSVITSLGIIRLLRQHHLHQSSLAP